MKYYKNNSHIYDMYLMNKNNIYVSYE